MVGSSIPESPSGIDAAWLNQALDGWPEIASVSHVDIGEGTGIFGQISRLAVGYVGDAGPSPTKMIVKMACLEPENLAIANAIGIYERELRFYEELVPALPVRCPSSYFAQRGDDGRFVLILEDLAGDFVVGDQVVGATLAQAEAIVDALVPFHVQWWEHPDLGAMDWLPYPNAPEYLAVLPGLFRVGLVVLEAEWADKISAKALDAAKAVEPAFEDLMERTSTGPRTVIHTDTRLDNVLFSADGSNEIALIDFQLALRGRAVADIAYLIGTSMSIADGSAHWEQLLGRWHDGVTAAGIEYASDDCLVHYKEAAMYYLSGAMALVGTFDSGNERGAAMAHAYATRILEHVADIDATDVL